MVRVWDLPTRLFHWLLAVAVVAQVTTGTIGGAALTWHFRVGYCVFALIVFRVVWGLVGGRWSRFATLHLRAGQHAALRARAVPRAATTFHVGHNPLGSASVFAMLVMLAAFRWPPVWWPTTRSPTPGRSTSYVSSAFALSD